MQRAQQGAKTVGTLRVQPGGWLVKQQQRRVHDEGSGQRYPLDHAARQIAGHFVGGRRIQADQLQLDHGGFTHQLCRQRAQLTQCKGDVLQHREG